MKKNGLFFIPILIFLAITLLGNKLFLSGNVSPTTLIIAAVVIFALLMLVRPKKPTAKPMDDVFEQVMGDYAADAFADDTQLSGKFQSALNDYSSNCPKAAISKLTKLAPQCRNDQETYAVAMATALCHISLQNYEEAIREYNRAIVLHPSSSLAVTIGSCNQRLGELKKAKDSYEFALELDPTNVEARSNLATAYVASRNYDAALKHAQLALELDEKHASSLATSAICYGLKDDALMYKHYTDLAVENGYSKEKIEKTVSALKK